MKRIVTKLILAFCFIAIISCDEDQDPAIYEGPSLTYFTEETGNFFVEDVDNATFQIPVGVTESSSNDRTFTVEVNEELTTASSNQYQLTSNSFVIPAGEYIGYVEVEGFYENISTEATTLAIDLVSVDGSNLADFKTTFSLGLNQFCPFEIPLEYNATAFLQGSATNSFQVTLVPTGNLNEYTSTDLWGDFVAAATGDPSYEGQYPYPGTINIACNNSITVTGDESYGPGGTGIYNPSNENITLTLSQALFTSDFTVDVVLTPAE